MRTTLDIQDDLLRRAKELAAKTNRPLRAVVEEALRRALDSAPVKPVRSIKLPVSKRKAGLRPGVDLDDSAALLDLMEGGDAAA